ncbi:hypothetical protein ACFVHQ_08755 [Actinomycetes bacterium NPDC127524]
MAIPVAANETVLAEWLIVKRFIESANASISARKRKQEAHTK